MGSCSIGLRIYCADRTKTWASKQKSHCEAIFNGFLLVTVKELNSYENGIYLIHLIH